MHVGQTATLSTAELPDRKFNGAVTRTANSLDPASRTLLVEIQVPNPEGKLMPGTYVQVDLNLPRKDPPLLIPSDTLVVRPAGTLVALVDANNTVHFQHIIVGRDLGERIEVLSGLKEDAGQCALQKAGASLYDLSFVETHDCFAVAELIEYEAMGLANRRQRARVFDEGIVEKNGKLPVNPSGGLKAKGHPIGATGVSMHAMSAMQLRGEAGEHIHLKDARLAGIFNMGGAAVANYVSLLEPVK